MGIDRMRPSTPRLMDRVHCPSVFVFGTGLVRAGPICPRLADDSRVLYACRHVCVHAYEHTLTQRLWLRTMPSSRQTFRVFELDFRLQCFG